MSEINFPDITQSVYFHHHLAAELLHVERKLISETINLCVIDRDVSSTILSKTDYALWSRRKILRITGLFLSSIFFI